MSEPQAPGQGGRARPVRLAYLGSPEIAVAPLKALVAAGHDVAVVVTNPDRRRGRGKGLVPTPVKAAAAELGLPVVHDLDAVVDADVELAVVVAFGHLIPARILDRVPMVNLHFSLLPRWRGAAPLERAILAGDAETGVCLMEIVPELDAGGVYARVRVPVGDKNLDRLRDDLVAASCALLIDTLGAGLGEPEPQVGEPTYAAKLHSEDFRLDWEQPAVELERLVRLGRAFTTIQGQRLRILDATIDADEPAARGVPGSVEAGADGVRVITGSGTLTLDRVQPQGRSAVAAADWRRGVRIDGPLILGS